MAEKFDPFSSGSTNYYNQTSEKKKSNGLVTFILVIILIGLGIYYGSNYLFLNKVDVTFNVKNTEGETIPANIQISKSAMFTDTVLNLQNGTTGELKKGTYYYQIQATGYKLYKSSTETEFKETFNKDFELEKNISLSLEKITFPEKVFKNQMAILSIEVINTSEKEIYDPSNIIVEGDIEDWAYEYVDNYQEVISVEDIVIPPKQRININLRYIVDDTGNKENDIEVRIKYKSDSKKTSFEITEIPDVTIKADIEKTIESGNNSNFTINIGNSKNSSPISDLKIALEINSEENENVKEWFNYDNGNILIPAKKNTTLSLSVSIPQYAKSDTLNGNLIFSSSAFDENKIIPIKITIEEPSIDFDTKLSTSETEINYDSNNTTTDKKYITLTLDNKSTIDIEIVNISILNLDPDKKDCNNYIYISENSLPDKRVIKNTKPEIPITIFAKDPSLIGDTINNSRICGINVEYKHPFRIDETINISKNIIINIEEKTS